jgi:hypothetical protein
LNVKVVNLGVVKDLLTEWERVRLHIVKGDIGGFQSVFCDSQQRETIFLGGVYKHDPQKALGAALKLSAARALEEDEPPVFRSSGL